MTNTNGAAPEKTDIELLDEQALKIARETLTGDIRDVILTDMKDRKTSLPWSMRKQAEQEEVIAQVTKFAEGIVSRVVKIVAAGGRKTIQAHLKKVTVQDEIPAVLELSKSDQQRHQLIDATGASVLVVVADHEIYQGERALIFATPDQSSIVDHDPETGEVKEIPEFLRRKKGGGKAGEAAA